MAHIHQDIKRLTYYEVSRILPHPLFVDFLEPAAVLAFLGKLYVVPAGIIKDGKDCWPHWCWLLCRNNTLRRKIGIHTNRHLLPQGIYYAGILKLAALATREKVSGEHSKPRQEAAVHYTPVF
jgi:hypothetical protein